MHYIRIMRDKDAQAIISTIPTLSTSMYEQAAGCILDTHSMCEKQYVAFCLFPKLARKAPFVQLTRPAI